MAADFDPYYKWLGIPPDQQPPSHYRLLGLDSFEDDHEVIEAAANRYMAYLHELASGPDSKHAQRLLNEISAVRVCLLDADRKSKYDVRLRAELDAQARRVPQQTRIEQPATKDPARPGPETRSAASPNEAGGDSRGAPSVPVAIAKPRQPPVPDRPATQAGPLATPRHLGPARRAHSGSNAAIAVSVAALILVVAGLLFFATWRSDSGRVAAVQDPAELPSVEQPLLNDGDTVSQKGGHQQTLRPKAAPDESTVPKTIVPEQRAESAPIEQASTEAKHDEKNTPSSDHTADPKGAPSSSEIEPPTAVATADNPQTTSPIPRNVDHPSDAGISTPARNQQANGVGPGDQGGGQGVFRNVPEAAKYTLVYDLAIPNTAAFNTLPVPYRVDNSDLIKQEFSRIAYYVELDDGSGLKWVYVSMDAFTDDVRKIGIPSHGPNGSFAGPAGSFQQPVATLNIFASQNAGVTTGLDISTGNIEFWSTNYGGGNAAGVSGARGGQVYDWGDAKVAGGGYGSMQVHNFQTGETLFAYNAWGQANGEVGIGNQPTGNPDWTFSNNIRIYSVKNMQILVLAATTISTAELPPITAAESEPARLVEDISLAAETEFDIELIGGHTAYRNPTWRPKAPGAGEPNKKSDEQASAKVEATALQFRLSATDLSRQWDVVHYPKPNSDGSTIARLTHEASTVTFRWTAAAAEHQKSAYLCNCLLAINAADTTHVVALRAPMMVSPLEIVCEMKGAATKPVTIEHLPDPRAVMVQITHLDGDFANVTFRPARSFVAAQGECFARFGPPGRQRLLLGFRSNLGSDLELRVAPYFVVDFESAPILLTSRAIKDVQQRAKRLEPQLVRQLKIAKARPPATPDRGEVITRLSRRLARCKAVPAQIGQLRQQFQTYYAGGEGKATIHYRVLLRSGDHQVDLLTTAEK